MATWQCVKHCGACCQLDPSDRPELADYLTAEQLSQYLGMVGEDGWCRHYDREQRLCTVYERRPDFCRVTAPTFEAMFGVRGADLNDFAIDCCEQQIEGVYGAKSEELARFVKTVEDR
ncbi:MAG: YkgJ family cysteine cluster protein [Cyanobacteria bacterium P01_A01_bin.105]